MTTNLRKLALTGTLALSAVGVVQAQSETESPKQILERESAAAAAAQPSAGVLPLPDYSEDLWTRQYLTGNWGGARTNLANKGVQVGLEWNQYVQSVVDGGRDHTTEYGGNFDYTINLDLMRMGVLPGALVKFRAESRYGRSVNSAAGAVLPVNTDLFFPNTGKPDQDIALTITDLNYTQFLSEHWGLFVGKLDTLDGDPNEFASGRGTGQFMNANFVFNAATTLRFPYSTLAAGVVWTPIPIGTNGGVTISSMLMNTADSSTTTGFEDFDKGQTWLTEADFQYRLGHLPGGMNVGALYSFNQDFRKIRSRLVFQPGQGLIIPTQNYTWAAYWSGWQYLYAREPGYKPVDLLNGEPDRQGVGLFARFGIADRQTNPIEWSLSGGVGGRGIFPTRDNDNFGIGYFYNSIQRTQFTGFLGLRNTAQGFEGFYNVAVTPACRTTLDLQVVKSVQSRVSVATLLGVRASVDF